MKFLALIFFLSAAGCSWPGVKIGGDKYLLSPLPTKADDKGGITSGNTREAK